MTSGTPSYPLLERIAPWVCVDLEINPETGDLLKGALLSRMDESPPASRTFDGNNQDGQKKYNDDKETHYYVVPRILYRKRT